MPVALITTNPLAIIERYSSPPAILSVPGLGDVHGADVGWTSPDGAYMLADVVTTFPPPGEMNTGDPAYTLEGSTLTETYATVPLPAATLASTKYNDAINAGIILTWVPSSALSGTYALDERSMHKINSIWTTLTANNAFPNNRPAHRWKMADGTGVTFSAAQFKNFATALSNYHALLDEAHYDHASGGSPMWPPNTVEVAG